VPALTPTIQGSKIIRVKYVLEVSAVIPNALNLNCDISLLVGNVPFENSGNLQLIGYDGTSGLAPNVSMHHDEFDGEDDEDDYNSSERHKLIYCLMLIFCANSYLHPQARKYIITHAQRAPIVT
jgi:hypothetical protein